MEKYVNALPAYLADRAYDMQGPRGANAKNRDGNLDLNAPKRRQSGPTDPKRKYTRRGQSLLEMQQLQQELQQPNIQQSLPSQQLFPQQQQSSHQEPPSKQQSFQFSSQYQQPLPLQQSLPQQSSHQGLPPQQQSSQFLQYESFDSLPISSTSTSAITFENFEYVC